MEQLRRIQDFHTLKILSDSRRLDILRLLMAGPATLSQLGQALGEHPAHVRHHLKLLQSVGLIEMVDTRVVRGFVEKYYRAKARAFFLNEIILPDNPGREVVVILGSHDMALELLAHRLLQKRQNPLELLLLSVGSLDGLVALRQGIAQIAGCHLLDVDSNEYNLPYVRHLFPDRQVKLIVIAHREQGLIVAPGNPRQIRGLEDLARPDVLMVNRNRGSGTRLWLDHKLAQLSLSTQSLRGYNHEVRTHTALAETISQGGADVGLGLRAAAQQFNLDFIPLFQERFDLVIPVEQVENQRLRPLLDHLCSAEFRRMVDKLEGYQSSHTGDQIAL